MTKRRNIRVGQVARVFAQKPPPQSAEVVPLFAQALMLHQGGRLAEAEKIYGQILGIKPDHFDSLHLLGVISFQRGDHANAVKLIDAALKISPDHVLALSNRGNALQATGRFEEALASYDRALALQPNNAEALANRGVLLHTLKRYEEALASYDRALALRPSLAAVLSNRGNTLAELNRFEDALASHDRAIALQPDYAEAHYNRGNACSALNRFEDALASYERALALRPDYAAALANRGYSLHKLSRFTEALASYDRALAVRGDDAEALANRGVTLNALRRFDEALASYDRALELRPDYADAFANRGVTLHDLKRFEEALADHERALALEPDDADALSNRGHTLHELRRFEEALASCERAIALAPDLADAHGNRANALNALGRYGEALEGYERALALRGDYPEAITSRGTTLHALRRFDEELACYERALALRGDYSEAHFNEGWCRLLRGDFERGLQKYEWRWNTAQSQRDEREFSVPQWRGEVPAAGKTILLHAEQGYGDTIQFCRYAPLLAERGARVVLEVQKPLCELMSTLAVPAQIVSRGGPLPAFDLHCPLLSLPLAFGTTLAAIPAQMPYLQAPDTAAARWAARLGARTRPRIGIAWSGSPLHKNDRNRSSGLAAMLPLLGIDASFVSLQRELRAEDAALLQGRSDVLHFGEELKTFADTAGLIANLDLVICVDTAAAHLAGAMAKPVWILLPNVPDWRWLLDRADSPWYPTARLFRLDESRAWPPVIARVLPALRAFVAQRSIDPR